MISTIVSRLVILTFGTLYPAYASYKAVRTKNVKEYVKWMMYWIVFALFTCAETFTDVFLSWFPFYYEIKIILVLWLLSPATKGSSILYRKFVHPMLSSREQEIDEYISKAKEQGYHTVLHLGQRGVNYATTVIMQTAIKGGGGIVSQLRKSYSLSDLTSDADSRADVRGLQERMDESSDVVDARLHRRRHSPRRSASGSSRVDMYFPEVDVRPGPSLGHVRSTEDVSSGYSSAEPLYVGHGQPPKLEPREGLTRTASVGGTSRPRTRTTRAGVATKKAAALPEDSEGSEESGSDSEITVLHYPINQKSVRTTIQEESNSSENSTEFIDTIGFPAENMAQKIKETVTTPKDLQTIPTEQLIENIQPIDSSAEVIEEKIENIHILEEQLIENIQPIDSSAEVIEEKIENIPISEEQNIKNIERDSSVELYEDVIVDKIEEIKIPEEQIHSNPDLDSSEVIYEDIVEDLGESIKTERNSNSDSSFEDTKETESIKTETISTTDSSFEDTNETFFDVNKNEKNLIPESIESLGTKLDTKTDLDTSENDDYETISLSSISQRGGRYNKHIAPGPPPSQDENDKPIPPEIQKDCSITKFNEPPEDLNIPNTKTQPNEPESLPIKATLVLKPGVIKKLGPVTEDPNRTQIFVSAQTPQTKRKPKSKHDSPISRLMMLPKKIFGHHTKESGHSSSENLRKSWHEDTRSLTPVSVENYSKSDTEGSQEHLAYMPSDGKKSDSKLVLRTLSHSPKQYRRRNREERYFEDSD